MDAALTGANRDRVGDEERLETGLDDKQSAKFAKHRHGYANAEQMASFRPFPIKNSG